jgi:hypothetical protein
VASDPDARVRANETRARITVHRAGESALLAATVIAVVIAKIATGM